MSNLRSALKKYPLAYSCYKVYKKLSLCILKQRLRCIGKNCAKNKLPSIKQAAELISSIRPKTVCEESCPERIVDESIDLSVIIPIYNAERFLKKCLESVTAQKSDYNIQIICIDDGSTDNSAQILDKFKENEKLVIIHQKNMGHSGARNAALSMKLGKYLMFIDSDDFIDESYLDKMLRAAYDTNADIVQSGFCKCNADSIVLDTTKCSEGVINSYDELERFGGAPWGRIYKTHLWDNICFPSGMMFEDIIIFNLIFRRANSIIGISDAYYMYRVYGSNTLDKLQGDPRLLDAVWGIKYVCDKAKELKLEKTEDYYSFFLGQCSKHVYYRIKHFDEKVCMACFVVLCDIVCEYNKGELHFCNDADIVLKKLEMAFVEHNYKTWKICSELLRNISG